MPDIIELVLKARDPERIISEIQAAVEKEKRARAEFIEWLTPDVKAEWIDGEVVIHPSATEGHLLATGCLFKIISAFASRNQLGKVRIIKALTRVGRHDLMPDVNFWTARHSEGWTKDKKIYPPPDFVVEVLSDSTEGRDRGVKFDAYREGAVEEYWLVDPRNETVEQYRSIFGEGEYIFERVGTYRAKDTVACIVLRGLEIPVAAIFDEARCFAEQRRIVNEST